MRFKVDENLHDDVATLLTAQGYDAHTVHTEALQGCSDTILSERCRAEERIIVTLDLDFSDIRTYPPADYAGLIVLRISDQSRQHVLNVMKRVVELLQREPVVGRLWIVSDSSVRIRSA